MKPSSHVNPSLGNGATSALHGSASPPTPFHRFPRPAWDSNTPPAPATTDGESNGCPASYGVPVNDLVQRFSRLLLYRIRTTGPRADLRGGGGANRVYPAQVGGTVTPTARLARGSSRVRIAGQRSNDEGHSPEVKVRNLPWSNQQKRSVPVLRHKSSLSSISAFVGLNRRAMAEMFDGQQMSGAWLLVKMLAVIGLPAATLVVMTGRMLWSAVSTQTVSYGAIDDLKLLLAVDDLVTNLQVIL